LLFGFLLRSPLILRVRPSSVAPLDSSLFLPSLSFWFLTLFFVDRME